MRNLSPARDCLRIATDDAHRRLERELNAIDRLRTVPERIDLVHRYFGFFAGSRTQLRGWIEAAPHLWRSVQRRCDLIEDDLVALGVRASSSSRADRGTAMTSLSEALGFLYVLEGSALGGRMILRAVLAHGASPVGLRFLDPHGAQTGDVWRHFLAILESEVGEDAARLEQAEAGARGGFCFARQCLCEGP